METETKVIAQTMERAFCGLAAVASHYHLHFDGEDADDFIETMMVIESLVENGGVNHRDLVARFRRGRPTEINGQVITRGNRDPTSQMTKLRLSRDPFYLASDGATNGAAMRAMAPAFYFTSFDEMVWATVFISRITHSSPVAHMAAVMVALAYRMSLFEERWKPPDLAMALSRAAGCLSVEHKDAALYFSQWLELPPTSSWQIAEEISFCHSAKSSPLAAVLVGSDVNFCYDFLDHGFPTESEHTIKIGDEKVEPLSGSGTPTTLLEEEPGRASLKRYDADTFYSMAYSLMTMRHTAPPKHGVFENFRVLTQELAARWA